MLIRPIQKIALRLIISMMILSPACLLAATDKLNIQAMPFPPYIDDVSRGQKPSGFLVDILEGISAHGKLEYQLSVEPFAKIGSNLKRGTTDAVLGLLYSHERSQYIHYPDNPIHNITFCVVSKEPAHSKLNSIEDLNPSLWYVTLQWGILSPELNNFLSTAPNRVNSPSFDLMIKMIVSGRVDLAIMPKLTAHHYAKKYQPSPHISKTVISQLPLYLAFSKKVPTSTPKYRQWENALQGFLKSDEYSRILKNYKATDKQYK